MASIYEEWGSHYVKTPFKASSPILKLFTKGKTVYVPVKFIHRITNGSITHRNLGKSNVQSWREISPHENILEFSSEMKFVDILHVLKYMDTIELQDDAYIFLSFLHMYFAQCNFVNYPMDGMSRVLSLNHLDVDNLEQPGNVIGKEFLKVIPLKRCSYHVKYQSTRL